MGCGILFPRDYAAPDGLLDSDGSRDNSDVSADEDEEDVYLEMDGRANRHHGYSSDSEDERWWERPQLTNSGTMVQVRKKICLGI